MKSSRAARGKTLKRSPSKPSNSYHQFTSLLSSEAHLIVMVSLVMVVFVCYLNSLRNGFVFDDLELIVNNEQINSFSYALLFQSYRPIRNISYALDVALWGKNAFGFHLTNTLIHAANVLLVFALVRRLSSDLIVATIAALIFAVHPIQTDAVAYISGRRDLLFSFFYLLAFHFYLNYYRLKWSARAVVYFALFLVSWLLSLMSKEMAVSLPALVFLWHFCEAWEPGESWWRQALVATRATLLRAKWLWLMLFVGVLTFTLYWALQKGGSERADISGFKYWGDSFYLNALTVIRVHAWYLKQLIFPTPIAQYLGAFEISRTIFDWGFGVALLVVGAVVGAGLFLLNRSRLMAFAILSYFVLLLPVSQIIPHHELLADHYLYLPMIGFGLMVALLVRRISSSNQSAGKVAYLVVAAAIAVFTVMTMIQNRTWKDERSLWTANYKAVPNSPRAALNLGDTYQNSEPEKAEVLFKRALGLNPPPDIKNSLHDRLAVILIQQKKYAEAQYFVADVLSRSPNDFFGNLWATQLHVAEKACGKAAERLSLAKAAIHKSRELVLFEQTKVLVDQCRK